MNLNKSFIKFCEDNEHEINESQISVIEKLSEFYNLNFKQSFVKKIFTENRGSKYFYWLRA